jgi:hypothetical protein
VNTYQNGWKSLRVALLSAALKFRLLRPEAAKFASVTIKEYVSLLVAISTYASGKLGSHGGVVGKATGYGLND